MNERGRNALRQAALDGVRQIFNALLDERGGRCAVGVLHDALPNCLYDWSYYGLDRRMDACPTCGLAGEFDEFTILVHGNDYHHFDFLKLAEFMPVSPEP